MQLTQSDHSRQKYLETSSKYGTSVLFGVRSEERIAILSNTVTCNRPLQHTACSLHWESGMHEGAQELYHKVYLTSRLPRVVLKANSHSGQQDQQEQDARTSCDQPSGSQSSRETWYNNVDYRILGKQDTNRKDRQSRKVDSAVREPPEQGIFPAGHEADGEER